MTNTSEFEAGLICKTCKTAAKLSCNECDHEEVFFQDHYNELRSSVINRMGLLHNLFGTYSVAVERSEDRVRISMIVFAKKISAEGATEKEALSLLRKAVIEILRQMARQLQAQQVET